MHLIDPIEKQRPEVIDDKYLTWLKETSLGQLKSEYRGTVAHVKEQMTHALKENDSGDLMDSATRTHMIMLCYPERLRLVSAEIAKRVGGVTQEKHVTFRRSDLYFAHFNKHIDRIDVHHFKGPKHMVWEADTVVFIDDDGTEKILKSRS